MRFVHIKAVFQKQIKETLKNKEVLVQFMMFPLLTVIMENLIHIEGMPEHYFTGLFSSMYVGMAPLVAMVSILAEEKEKGTLRALLMADVKAAEYLAGVGSYVWLVCMFGSCVFMVTGEYEGKEALFFLGIMGVGILISLVFGAAIGVSSRNQMGATAISVPVMLALSFLPMLSAFNETLGKVAKVVYTQQVSLLVSPASGHTAGFGNISIILANVLLVMALFGYAYKKAAFDEK